MQQEFSESDGRTNAPVKRLASPSWKQRKRGRSRHFLAPWIPVNDLLMPLDDLRGEEMYVHTCMTLCYASQGQ